MAGIGNNLYPPIISAWMPSFVRTAACRVYFSLSSYNSAAEIKNVQVIVSNQNSSLSALDPSQYPANIKITDLRVDGDVTDDSKYYIIIKRSDLQDGEFEIGQYYKVQLRFSSVDFTQEDQNQVAKWLSENTAYFSEWSTVCLIKGIEQPKIYLRDLDSDPDALTQLSTQVVDIVGRMYYDENEELEDEYLKYYEINITDESTGKVIFQSGIIYTNEFYPNEINYTLKTNLTNRTPYNMEFIYTTNNGYSETLHYRFTSIIVNLEAIDATITATPDEENGRIAVHVLSNSSEIFIGNLCIRRASSETDYTIWEDINIITYLTGTLLDYTWYDYTVKSGIYYHYCVQKITTKGFRGMIVQTHAPAMIYLDDMFLTTNGMQLRIKYDPSISSFKTNVSESKTETLGSKYPFIRRNGNVAYRSFSISGLITGFCDSDHLFSSREEFFGNELERYDDYNEQEQITEYKDFLYEREFREKIMNFLYDPSVKLFRSLPEGNILVRLMDISFTPNSTLGRMLYSFSATAYEIDECSIDNYNKYGILSVGEYQQYIEYDYSITGQVFETTTPYYDIIDELREIHEYEATEGFLNELQHLTWIRIEFQSDPYLIECGVDGSLTIITDPQDATENTVNGYIVYINGEAILVSGRRYYELKDPDTIVTSIYFPNEVEVIIDYTAWMNEVEDTSKLASRIYNYVKVGQLWGTFAVNDSVLNQIYAKYYINYTAYFQELEAIDRITIEAEPGTIVYIKDSFDDDYYKHEIGDTGILDFYDEEATISSLYFGGVHLNEMKDYERFEAEDWEYRETGITVNSVDEISNPVKHGVYTILTPLSTLPLKDYDEENKNIIDIEDSKYNNMIQQLADSNNRYIYYRDDWYVFTEDNIVLCPVEGIVDYIFEILKGEY